MGSGNHSKPQQLCKLERIDFVVFELCLTDVFDVQGVCHNDFFHTLNGREKIVENMPVGGTLEGGFAGVVVAILCHQFGETLLVVALVDAPFVDITTVGMKDVNLAKRLV